MRSVSKTMLQFTMAAWQRTLENSITLSTLLHVSLTKLQQRTFRAGWKRTFTNFSSRQWMPFVKSCAPFGATFTLASWKHSHQKCQISWWLMKHTPYPIIDQVKHYSVAQAVALLHQWGQLKWEICQILIILWRMRTINLHRKNSRKVAARRTVAGARTPFHSPLLISGNQRTGPKLSESLPLLKSSHVTDSSDSGISSATK